jgi:hypothetical protein
MHVATLNTGKCTPSGSVLLQDDSFGAHPRINNYKLHCNLLMKTKPGKCIF